MSEGESTQGVELRSALVDRVERRLPGTEFESVGAYVEFVLEEVLAHVEATVPEEDVEELDEAAVREQLRALGYADE